VVASGYVRNANGSVVAGATVELYLDVPTDGSTTQTAPLSTTTSDGSGYYALTAPYSGAVASQALASGGWVNFDIEGTGGDIPYAQVVARHWDGTSGTWQSAAQLDGLGGAAALGLMPVYDDGTDLSAQPGASVRNGDWPNVSGPCRYASYETTTLLSTQSQPTVIGELHVAKDATGTFTYGVGSRADSHISVGLSSGGWHLGGFSHVSASDSAVVGISNVGDDWAHQLTSRFSYGLYQHDRWTLDPVTGSRIFCGSSKSVGPRRWLGNIQVGTDLSQYLHLCTTTYKATALSYAPKAFFDRTSRKLKTWEGAAYVNVGGATLGLRAWSGASQWVTYHYKFGTKYPTHWLCGNDDVPAYSSRIFAGA
jgi:hypothetical protein